jgi:hypothetical protein
LDDLPGPIFTKLRRRKLKRRAFVCIKISNVTLEQSVQLGSTREVKLITIGEFHPTGKCMQCLDLRLRSCLRPLIIRVLDLKSDQVIEKMSILENTCVKCIDPDFTINFLYFG